MDHELKVPARARALLSTSSATSYMAMGRLSKPWRAAALDPFLPGELIGGRPVCADVFRKEMEARLLPRLFPEKGRSLPLSMHPQRVELKRHATMMATSIL